MALVKCPECGHDMASDAASCPNCGAPVAARAAAARAEQARTRQEQSRKRGCLFMLGLLVFIIVFGSIQNSNDPGDRASVSSEQRINYQVMQEWKIPAGGFGRVLAIDSVYRNETDLRRLGEQLRDESPTTRFMFFEVYDDTLEAKRRQRWVEKRLSKAQEARHLRHRIGIYTRNRHTGHHTWMMALEGMNGEDWPHIEVKYDTSP